MDSLKMLGLYFNFLFEVCQVFIVQLLSAIDASATNSLHCSRSSAMLHSVILRLPAVFHLVTLALLRSTARSIHLFDGLPLDLFHLAATDSSFYLIFLIAVCLIMSLQDYSKSYEWIMMNFFGWMEC